MLFVAIGKAFAGEPVDVQTVATGLQYSEGTIFVGDTLYFVDYNASDVLRLAKNGAVQRVWHQDGCAANGLVQTGTRLLVACYDSGTIAEITQDGRLIDTIRSDDKGVPFVYPNDLTADRKGGVYFTASGSAVTPGKVYYRSADRRVREVASNIRYSNGLAVSPNGKRLYVAESEASRLLVYSIAEDGGLSERQVFVDLGQLLGTQEETAVTPDGVRVDRNGNVFVALYRGGGFAVFSPGGTLLRSVKLPGEHHTNLAISPDGKAVFVTAIHDTSYGGESRSELLKVPNPLRE
ncbi:SMP-30/gluconolactonase/LRE family protein [Paraburkholderia xenovorans]|uniref:SMP-30/gluconolactonase/LRE family protein n=1 Tax=Paraburkholderia xenovorans TaxID=36873 RepID=UPI0038BAE2CB